MVSRCWSWVLWSRGAGAASDLVRAVSENFLKLGVAESFRNEIGFGKIAWTGSEFALVHPEFQQGPC